MIVFQQTSDCTNVYRDSTALCTLRMDRTSDTGSLLSVLRDSVLTIGAVTDNRREGKIPEVPSGSMEAVSLR